MAGTEVEDLPVYAVEDVREWERPRLEAERRGEAPADVLMRAAAWGLAGGIRRELRARRGNTAGARVVLLVGAGGNGGDALYAGAFLQASGTAVTAVLLAPERTHAPGVQALRAQGSVVVRVGDHFGTDDAPTARSLSRRLRRLLTVADVAVDGIVGLGGTGPLRPPAAALVDCLAAHAIPIVSVDLPSGVDADTGRAHHPHVTASRTVTFGPRRLAHVLAPEHCGTLDVIAAESLGMPAPSLDTAPLRQGTMAGARNRWPRPGPADDKYSLGVVGLRAGSARYPGAGILATRGACLATSGMVRVSGPTDLTSAILATQPEVVTAPTVADTGRVTAWVCGPGAGVDEHARAELVNVLASGVPAILDADALTLLAAEPELLREAGTDTSSTDTSSTTDAERPAAPLLLTPHASEWQRLATGWGLDAPSPAEDPRGAALALARHVDHLAGRPCIALLKGRRTVIASAAGCWIVVARSSWAATPGTGDVLAGILGARWAAELTRTSTLLELTRATADAALVHAEAAHVAAAGAPTTAGRIVDALPTVLARAEE